MDAPSGSQEPVAVVLRWSDGDDAALAELVPLISAPIRSRLEKSFLGIDVGYVNFAPRAKKRSAAHEQGLLSRRTEGEEFREVDSGREHSRCASSRGEL